MGNELVKVRLVFSVVLLVSKVCWVNRFMVRVLWELVWVGFWL